MLNAKGMRECSFHPDGKGYISFPSSELANKAGSQIVSEGLKIHCAKQKGVDWKGVNVHRASDPTQSVAIQVRIEDQSKPAAAAPGPGETPPIVEKVGSLVLH